MPTRRPKRRSGINGTTAAMLTLGGGLGALAIANRVIASQTREAFSVLNGESRVYPWTEGDVFYKVQGQGAPLVLVHGIHAGASAFEWRKNVDALAQHFRVYAPDLPGYGLSSRPAFDYTAQTYIQLLLDFIREAAGGAEHPVHVIASSLSAAHIIKAAFQRPKLFERLVLVEPTGIYELNQPPTPAQRAYYRVLRAPILGTSIYNAIVSRSAIRSYLSNHVYLRPEAVTDDLVDYYHNSAHQPGARYAPISFLTGYLNVDIAEIFARIPQETLIVWGKQASVTPASETQALKRLNPRVQMELIDGSSMLPHEEQTDLFHQKVIAWLRQPAAARS